jgi:peptidyl-prolyl cis-trans isomerase SurA
MMTLRLLQTMLHRPLAVLLILCSVPVAAQETQRVAAVVNDDMISLHDLESRMRLVIITSNLPDTVESRSRVGPSVLRSLIDDRLKIQEAERLKISISTAEINAGIATIERQNNMSAGYFETYLKKNGIDIDTMRQQIRAERSWVRVVRQELIPDVHIGEAEIDARLAALRANLGKPEYLVAEIFLAVEDLRHEAEVRQLGDRLIEQMKQGAPFSALARQFSQTGSAGGDLGWVSDGMLDDDLMGALRKLDKGNVTPPIRTIDGYHILFLRDKRIAGEGISNRAPIFDLLLIQIPDLPSSTSAERDEQLKRLRDMSGAGKNCDDFEKQIKDLVPSAEVSRTPKVNGAEIPPDIQSVIADLKPGQISEPLQDPNARRLFAVCGRTDPTGGLPSRDDIRSRIENEQLENMARRYLRDLRRGAFIEIRI